MVHFGRKTDKRRGIIKKSTNLNLNSIVVDELCKDIQNNNNNKKSNSKNCEKKKENKQIQKYILTEIQSGAGDGNKEVNDSKAAICFKILHKKVMVNINVTKKEVHHVEVKETKELSNNKYTFS